MIMSQMFGKTTKVIGSLELKKRRYFLRNFSIFPQNVNFQLNRLESTDAVHLFTVSVIGDFLMISFLEFREIVHFQIP